MNETEDQDDLEEVARLLKRAVDKQRGLADFFDYPDRDVKEQGIAADAFAAAGLPVEKLTSRGNEDPPDCEAILYGRRVGIELTELVDQEAIEKFKKTKFAYDWAEWTRDEFIGRLRQCIERKDSVASVKGGPYDDYYLIIYSDEWTVASQNIEEELRGMSFPTRLITHALLLLSYDPRTKSYPVFQLPVAKF